MLTPALWTTLDTDLLENRFLCFEVLHQTGNHTVHQTAHGHTNDIVMRLGLPGGQKF